MGLESEVLILVLRSLPCPWGALLLPAPGRLGPGLESGLSPSLLPCLVPVSRHPHSTLSLLFRITSWAFSRAAGLGWDV